MKKVVNSLAVLCKQPINKQTSRYYSLSNLLTCFLSPQLRQKLIINSSSFTCSHYLNVSIFEKGVEFGAKLFRLPALPAGREAFAVLEKPGGAPSRRVGAESPGARVFSGKSVRVVVLTLTPFSKIQTHTGAESFGRASSLTALAPNQSWGRLWHFPGIPSQYMSEFFNTVSRLG